MGMEGMTVGEGAAGGAISGGLLGGLHGANLLGTGDLINTPDKENHKIRHRLLNILTGAAGGAGIGTVIGGAAGGINNLNRNNEAIANLGNGLKQTNKNVFDNDISGMQRNNNTLESLLKLKNELFRSGALK